MSNVLEACHTGGAARHDVQRSFAFVACSPPLPAFSTVTLAVLAACRQTGLPASTPWARAFFSVVLSCRNARRCHFPLAQCTVRRLGWAVPCACRCGSAHSCDALAPGLDAGSAISCTPSEDHLWRVNANLWLKLTPAEGIGIPQWTLSV
jgi:hypothetical protein